MCAVLLGAAVPAGATSRVPPGALLGAEVALTRGEYAEAARALRVAAGASRSAEVAERAARVAFEYGQPRELERIASDWLSWDPKAETARRFHAIALLEQDRVAPAAADLKILVDTAYPTPAAAFGALQEALGGLDSVGSAAAAIGALLPGYAQTPEAYLAHAELSLRAANSPAAIASSERALALRPNEREALWLRARARVLGHDCDRGLIEAASLAAEGSPRDGLIYAWLLSSCERVTDARRILGDLARQAPVKAEALELLASLALDEGRLDEAQTLYADALATAATSDTATFGLAKVAERRGDRQRAERLYAGVTEGAQAVAAQLSLYRLLLDGGEPQIAARVLDEFVRRSPERLGVTAGRAELLSDHGRATEAIALLGRARRVYPDDAGLAMSLAAALEKAGRLDEALAVLVAERRERPDDPLLANALGYTLADHGRDLPGAEKLIRAALLRRPDSPAIQDSLGWVLYRQNRTQDAIGWLAHAYAGEPDPEVALHLGEAQWAAGAQTDAEATWRKALSRSPRNQGLRDALATRGLASAPAADPPDAP